MNEKNLYYKRGTYIIDKLLKIFTNDSTFYEKRAEFFKEELKRIYINRELVYKDFNSFYITSLTSLLGINKENIEKVNKHNDYNMDFLNNQNKNDKNLNILKNNFKEFDSDRKINTIYDDWLSVENCDYPTLNYLMNIRNGLMHSEYEPLDDYGYMLSINNGNYTHFRSKVLLPGIMNFCSFYFGNNSYTGLLEKFNIYAVDRQKINNTTDLLDALGKAKIIEVEYENITKNYKNKIPELKLYKFILEEQNKKNKTFQLETLLKTAFSNNYTYTTHEKSLDANQIILIEKMIEKYYGNEFYNLDAKAQTFQIGVMIRYLMDSRSVISEWICDFIGFLKSIQIFDNKTRFAAGFNVEDLEFGPSGEENIRSVFACRTSLLIVKLYHILYRLQNKKYEEIDYNKINFDLSINDYNYQRLETNCLPVNNFEVDKAKLRLKEPTLTDRELECKVICEIIRNSLSHGNVEMNFKIESGVVVEYIIFEDIYHSKSRKLEMTLDKLESFLKSEAFENKNCLIKENCSKSL